MRFLASVSDLKAAIKQASAATAAKSANAALQCLRIVATAEGLVLTGTNNAITLSVPCAANVETPGSILLDAGNLKQVMAVLPEGTVEFSTSPDSTNRVDVRVGKSAYKLNYLDPADFPPTPVLAADRGISVEAADMRKVLDRVTFSIAPDDNKYGLNGLHIEAADGDTMLRAVATDGNRLSWAQVPFTGVLDIGRRMLIPLQAVLRLRGLVDGFTGPVLIAFAGSGAQATVGGSTLHMRLMEAEFPNYKEVVPTSFLRTVDVERAMFLESLRRVSIFAKDGSRSVRFAFGEESILLSSRKLDAGDAREELPAELRGEPISMGFNADYIQEAVEAAGGGTIRLRLGDELSPAIVRGMDTKETEDDSCLFVVMPVRLD